MTNKPETSQQRLTAVQTACVHLLAARALLRSVGANEAGEYVQRALKGAERHATRLGARPRNIVFEARHAGRLMIGRRAPRPL